MGFGKKFFWRPGGRSYAEKLRDPRWQTKRAEIIAARNGHCEKCNGTARLEVHHGYYKPGAEPWDYESDTLWCLCRSCHEQTQAKMTAIHCMIAKIRPIDLDELSVKVGDATHEVQYGFTKEEAEYILKEMRDEEADLYCGYRIALHFSNEYAPTRVDEVTKMARDRFPGVQVDTHEDRGTRDCTGSVDGPDRDVRRAIQSWLDSQAR